VRGLNEGEPGLLARVTVVGLRHRGSHSFADAAQASVPATDSFRRRVAHPLDPANPEPRRSQEWRHQAPRRWRRPHPPARGPGRRCRRSDAWPSCRSYAFTGANGHFTAIASPLKDTDHEREPLRVTAPGATSMRLLTRLVISAAARRDSCGRTHRRDR
jgi:hypothetical protein